MRGSSRLQSTSRVRIWQLNKCSSADRDALYRKMDTGSSYDYLTHWVDTVAIGDPDPTEKDTLNASILKCLRTSGIDRR